jgi:hypothetical protein
VKEFPNLRERFGGGKTAINKHSVRYYGHGGQHYRLDRTLDASPPFFTLESLQVNPGQDFERAYFYGELPHQIPKTLKVNGQRHWGDGFTWKQAEAMAEMTLKRKLTDPA